MQNEQAEQNLYETAGAEQTERSERSETRSSVNRFAYMSAEAPALRGELRGSADHPTAEGSIFAYWLDGALYLQAELLEETEYQNRSNSALQRLSETLRGFKTSNHRPNRKETEQE